MLVGWVVRGRAGREKAAAGPPGGGGQAVQGVRPAPGPAAAPVAGRLAAPGSSWPEFIADLVDKVLDLGQVPAELTDKRGYPPYDPRLMLRLVPRLHHQGPLFAGKGADDIAFGFLAAEQAPGFRSISRFRRRHLDALRRPVHPVPAPRTEARRSRPRHADGYRRAPGAEGTDGPPAATKPGMAACRPPKSHRRIRLRPDHDLPERPPAPPARRGRRPRRVATAGRLPQPPQDLPTRRTHRLAG